MSERNLLLIALSSGMRFPTVRGPVSTEDLFEMPLTSSSTFSLNDAAKGLNARIKALGEESFVENADSAARRDLTDRLDVIKFVIEWRQELNKAESEKRERRAKRAKLIEALDNRESADLAAMSKDDILKALEELD